MLELRYQGEPSDLALLLQAEFQVEATVGCTMREFLCMEMEICGDYANRRIQTIFIDGTAVDDFDTAQVNSGTRLTLSGAMPGLVGATMRRGGVLSGLRSSISYKQLDEMRPAETQGLVNMRLYNFIAGELAHIFLGRGVRIAAPKLAMFLNHRPELLDGFRCQTAPGRWEALSPADAANLLVEGQTVRIKHVAPQPVQGAA